MLPADELLPAPDPLPEAPLVVDDLSAFLSLSDFLVPDFFSDLSEAAAPDAPDIVLPVADDPDDLSEEEPEAAEGLSAADEDEPDAPDADAPDGRSDDDFALSDGIVDAPELPVACASSRWPGCASAAVAIPAMLINDNTSAIETFFMNISSENERTGRIV